MRRRGFLAGLMAGSAAPSISWAGAGGAAFIGAARCPDQSFALIGLTSDLRVAFEHPIPARGHSGAAHPWRAEAVLFARRPGRFALVLDCARGDALHRLEPPDGSHFYGHGAFSADGDLLLTTENEYETGSGRIGLWDVASGYRRVGEIASNGIGPHEIIRLHNDGYAVANGGIRTHPATGREKLNLPDMASNLTILNADLGVEAVTTLPARDQRYSIRHIAQGPDDAIIMGLQWNDERGPTQSPLAVLDRDGLVHRPTLPTPLLTRSEGYVGSVAVDAAGVFYASAPRGNCMFRVSATEFLSVAPGTDLCGLAANGDRLLISQGDGGAWLADGSIRQEFAVNWDNHLLAVGA
ncbi:DUF1513 domain-containing protein [Pontivivens insulae]|uniref:Twin-arginine translocation pathway signal n=1 Tax=Pontivivens insulae TaxID=1639689 RepID=A0A2R8A8W5_9RHOB|nr:DUF1513 domain-containing protein [Pontivivens insulae]RED18769.1 hypothetical protein DFR53_0969 [Pontivivens insulae]SPF28667.1 hypothetical protein POI8812_00970 [Pontivivens insulae]